MLHQPQYGGVCQLPDGSGGVLHKAQRVAGQVLDIHGQQLRTVVHQVARHQGGTRHIHHAAHRQWAGLAARFQQLIAAVLHLAQTVVPVAHVGDHREYHPQIAVRGSLQHGLDLRLEQPVAFHTSLHLPGPGGVVVGAGIAAAHQQGDPLGVFQQLAQAGGLCGRALVIQKRRLGAHNAHARRAVGVGQVVIAQVAGGH